MPEGFWLGALTILFGAVAGGLTNTIAIWGLFHPYEPPKIGRWRIRFLQGAVPKNQARLAEAIGRTVGTRLLTAEDLSQIFQEGEFRGAFDERLSAFLDVVLKQERGSLREVLPASVIPRLESLLDDLVNHGLEHLEVYVRSERFEEMVAERAHELMEAVADEPIGGVLTPAREEAIREAVEEWLAEAAESEDLKQAVEDYLDRAAHRLLEPEKTFESILPLGLVGSFERAIQSYLPLAIERIGTLLEDPHTRARFESTLHDLFHRFLDDLKFHQRMVARLIVTDDTLERVLDTIEKEGAERLSELLRETDVQEAMARGINDAIVDFLRRPVHSVLGDPGSDNVIEARGTLVEWAVNLAQDGNTRAFLVERLDHALEKASARTWGDVVERLPIEKIRAGLIEAARSEAAEGLARAAIERMVEGILDRPIGKPADWLPEEAPEKIEEALSEPLWGWLQTQVPLVVERLNVARRVEEKVLEFPTEKMEALVRKVTDRELRLIVNLGYVLGAIIGSLLVLLTSVMPS